HARVGVGHFADVAVGRVPVAAVFGERVALDLVREGFVEALVFAFDFLADPALAVVFGRNLRRRRFFDARVGQHEHAPGLVAGDRVAGDEIVAPAGDRHAGADEPRRAAAGRGRAVVVVHHAAAGHDPADVLALRARRGRRVFGAAGADAVLRGGRVVVVLALRRDALLVVDEFGVRDHHVPARVRARVAEVVALGLGVLDRRVAVRAGADVVAGVGHVVGVGVVEHAGAVGVRGVDAVLVGGFVLAAPVGRGRAQVFARPGADFLVARGAAAVEPDRVATGVRAEEVAGREVLKRDAARLVDHNPVVAGEPFAFGRAEVLVGFGRGALGRAGLRAVDHHGVAVHAADVDVRLGDQDVRARTVIPLRAFDRAAARLFPVAGGDQHPPAGRHAEHGKDDRDDKQDPCPGAAAACTHDVPSPCFSWPP